MRDTSAGARAALYAPQTGEAFLHLIAIDHDDLASPIYLTDNLTDIVSNGITYTAFPIVIGLTPDVPGELPQIDATICAVDRSIITAVRSIATPPEVNTSVIMASTPDTIECGPMFHEATGIDYNATEVRMRLEGERFLTEPWPSRLYTPTNSPLLFQAVRQ